MSLLNFILIKKWQIEIQTYMRKKMPFKKVIHHLFPSSFYLLLMRYRQIVWQIGQRFHLRVSTSLERPIATVRAQTADSKSVRMFQPIAFSGYARFNCSGLLAQYFTNTVHHKQTFTTDVVNVARPVLARWSRFVFYPRSEREGAEKPFR